VEVAALGPLAAEQYFSTACFGVFHLFFDFLALRPDVDRTHAGFFARAVADGFLFEDLDEAADKIVRDGFLQEQSFDAEAHLAAIKVTADVSHLHGEIEVGVFHHDHRIATAQFQSATFDLAPGHFPDVAAYRRRAGESDAPNARVAQQFFTNTATRAGHDIDRAFRQALLRFAFSE